MATQAANQQQEKPSGPQTGQVWAVSDLVVAIEGTRYFLGPLKTDAVVGDIVVFEADDNRNLIRIDIIERAADRAPAPETQPAGPAAAEEKKPAQATTPKGSAKRKSATGPGMSSPSHPKKDPPPEATQPGKFTLPAWIPDYCHNGKDGCNFYATGGFCGKACAPISEMNACPAPRGGSGTPTAAAARQAEADRTSADLEKAVKDAKDKASQGAPAGQRTPTQPAAAHVQKPPNPVPAQQPGAGGISFRKATRKAAKLRLGLVGPAGSGKTWDALNIALGIGGRIAVVDTENSSAELYSHLGEYDVLVLHAPFTVQKYIDAIRVAEREGYDTIILDSITHAWSGEGGLLDVKDQIARNSRTGNSFTAWKDVTPLHYTFIEAMLQSKCHIIATMRSKTEYILDLDDRGRQVPRKVGMAPIQREGMDYEFTLVFDIDAAHIATASKDRTSLFTGKSFQPSMETGRVLKEWLDAGGA